MKYPGSQKDCQVDYIFTVYDLAWNSDWAVFAIDATAPNISFTDNVEVWPVQSDTVTVDWDDATVKKWMYDVDGTCSTNSGDYTYTDATSMNQTTEINNGNYICLYAEDSVWNDLQLASANDINVDITVPSISFTETLCSWWLV